MKKIFTLLLIALCGTAFSQDWLSDIEEAKQKAKAENKIILLSFSGYDWCKSCLRLKKEVFDTENFVQFSNEKLVLLKADFPRKKPDRADKQIKHNEALAEQYNLQGTFPLVVLINADGSVLGNIGYESGGAEKYIERLNSMMN